MANDLTVEGVTKASWATLSPALKDTFLYLWEGVGVALSIRSGASSSCAGQRELQPRVTLPSACALLSVPKGSGSFNGLCE